MIANSVSSKVVTLNLWAMLLLVVFTTEQFEAEEKCRSKNSGIILMSEQEIQMQRNDGSVHTLRVLIADDDLERSAGFQFICPKVIDNTLILFRFQNANVRRFHMRNVYAALDIGFFDDEGYLIKVLEMKPYISDTGPLYHPGKPFRYALEARKGYFAKNDLIGMRVRLQLE